MMSFLIKTELDMKQLLISFLWIISTYSVWAQNGLKADYYNGTNFNQFVASGYVDKLDFYWDRVPPVPGLDPNECSVRYTGKIKTPKSGTITFSARVDDGIRVWVNEVQVINNWQLNDVGYSNGTIYLETGKEYALKIEYFNALREAELRLLWKLPLNEEKSWWEKWWNGEEDFTIVPAEYFTPPPPKIVKDTSEIVSAPAVEKQQKPVTRTKPETKKVKPIAPPSEKEVVEEFTQYIPKNVAFDRAKSEILAVSYSELDKLADYLVQHPEQKVRIEGHTDNMGDPEKNLRLSERRAYAVAAYLIKKGVVAKQLNPKGFGSSRPLVASDDGQYHPENRRVVFILE